MQNMELLIEDEDGEGLKINCDLELENYKVTFSTVDEMGDSGIIFSPTLPQLQSIAAFILMTCEEWKNKNECMDEEKH